MSDTVKIKTSLGFTFSIHSEDSVHDTEMTRAEWDALTKEEQQATLNEYLETEIANSLDCSVVVADDEDDDED